MESNRRLVVAVLMFASAGFAYAFGRQQGDMEAREELGIRLEASLPNRRTELHDIDEAPDLETDAESAAGAEPATLVNAHHLGAAATPPAHGDARH